MQRFLLYQLRNTIIQPFGETAQQVFARVSAYREMMTGTGVGFCGTPSCEAHLPSTSPSA